MSSSESQGPDHERLLREVVSDFHTAARTPGPPPVPDALRERLEQAGIELQEPVGRGGMGVVYRALQRKLGRAVAVKVLAENLAEAPGFVERFAREARALASLNHPHILTVHDFGDAGGHCYLVTELVDGISLRQLMDQGQLSPSEALRITPQICDALHYAHSRGVVHRDIKPENVLIDTEGQVKIADFGLAKLLRVDGGLTRNTEVFGTPQYMAPEQWRGSAEVDHRADIFSLGVVLYEMLTGHLPVGQFDPPSARAGVPRGLDDVVRRSLAQRPENRYQSAHEVADDVARQRVDAPAARHQGRAERRAKQPRSTTHKVLVGCGCLLLVGVLGMVVMALLLVPMSMESGAGSGPHVAIGAVSLVGETTAEVVRKLGPPLSITTTRTHSEWSYRTATGRQLDAALTVARGRVISHHPDAHMLQRNPKPANGPYLGQSVEEITRQLGPPASTIAGAIVTKLRYDNELELTIADGLVVGILQR
ncbi:MAG: serine/threonine protein kinase [Planctomycetes bacterium]|nr:serine/threonine protein kinase [Planctomycetota bacterium]